MPGMFRPDYQTICIILMIVTLLLTGIHITLIATSPAGGEDENTGPGMQLGRLNNQGETDQGSENIGNIRQGTGLHRMETGAGTAGLST